MVGKLQLADFGNRVPQITAEIELSTPALGGAIGALASRAGCGTVDVASLDQVRDGFVEARFTTARAAIEGLMVGFALIAHAVAGRGCDQAAGDRRRGRDRCGAARCVPGRPATFRRLSRGAGGGGGTAA
jgi:hypothetical protein